jgi:uncharacterized protein (DUF362 family)
LKTPAENTVIIKEVSQYDSDTIYESLPDSLFDVISPTDKVVLKPNWVRQSHQFKAEEWDYVITHPAIITAVLKKVCEKLDSRGKIIILDGPETPSSFEQILQRNPVALWQKMCSEKQITLEIIDLRDDEWEVNDTVIVSRKKLPGDPHGSAEVNLGDKSEFYGHTKSAQGYYGADYNIKETNDAHDGNNNIYRVSKSVIDCDVFINLPKLKTHKKSGITCCLKNLVGVNTYKNYLPHYSLGSPKDGGDQFPDDSVKHSIESWLLGFIKQNILIHPKLGKMFSPFSKQGKKVFGDTKNIIRSGNWYGNDTIWRMILDINKILLYANPDGSMKGNDIINQKKYIGIVDAIVCGEKNGPKAPDPKKLGLILAGNNPLAIDTTCAHLMGIDPLKLPMISHAFGVKNYKISDHKYEDILLDYNGLQYNLMNIPSKLIKKFEPHFGWKNHIESSSE